MKQLILLLLTIFSLSCCNNDDDKPIAEIDKLPPLTNTGANKAGCLVNGVAFLPKGYSQNGTNLQVYYDGQNFDFSITENVNNVLKFVMISYNNQLLDVNTIYLLNQNSSANLQIPFGYGFFSNSQTDFNTNNINKGELKITHHNFNLAIISGTFWFDAVNSNGEKVEIREGRFDMQY